MRCTALIKAEWRDPIEVLAGSADEDFTFALASGGPAPLPVSSLILRSA